MVWSLAAPRQSTMTIVAGAFFTVPEMICDLLAVGALWPLPDLLRVHSPALVCRSDATRTQWVQIFSIDLADLRAFLLLGRPR